MARVRAAANVTRPQPVPSGLGSSEAFRQAQRVGGDMAEDQVRADRRDLIEARFAELALDVVFLGKAEAAVRLHALILVKS